MTAFFDENNIVGHHLKEDATKFDFGDGCAETARYFFGVWYRSQVLGLPNWDWPNRRKEDLQKAIDVLEINKSGVWRRHNVQYSEPTDFSRDQQIPMQCTLSVYGFNEEVKRMLDTQYKRSFWRYQNKDVRVWEYALDFRCLNFWWSYPVICFFDIGLLINAIIRIIMSCFTLEDCCNHLNLGVTLKFSVKKYPTPLSVIAYFLYYWLTNVHDQWAYYFRHDEDPPLNELWEPVNRP